MQIFNIEVKNPSPLLTDLVEIIRNDNDSSKIYLSGRMTVEPGKYNRSGNSKNALGVPEAALPIFLKSLGIRSLTLNSSYDEEAISRHQIEISDGLDKIDQWQRIKNDRLIKDLKALFQNCRTIAFYDWTTVPDASCLWDGILRDVIRPLNNTNLDFIFYLGDPSEKVNFLVDEILDIISAFSKHGTTTFCLDETEAIKLWQLLNGETFDSTSGDYTSSELKRKYFHIFIYMKIDRLMIYSAKDVILYSEEDQFMMTRKITDHNIEISKDARDNFISGYSIGLLHSLKIEHCITLGLIVFGACGEYKIGPGRQQLLAYIEKWVSDLNKPNTIYLDQ